MRKVASGRTLSEAGPRGPLAVSASVADPAFDYPIVALYFPDPSWSQQASHLAQLRWLGIQNTFAWLW
jgi:hypothetical protein